MFNSDCEDMRDIEHMDKAELIQELRLLKARISDIEDRLHNLSEAEEHNRNRQKPPFTYIKTENGLLVESATKLWLKAMVNIRSKIRYKETLHHAKCCMCQTEDLSLTALTVIYKKKQYVVPLCGACYAMLDKRQSPKREPKSINWSSVIKTPFETNRRKFCFIVATLIL